MLIIKVSCAYHIIIMLMYLLLPQTNSQQGGKKNNKPGRGNRPNKKNQNGKKNKPDKMKQNLSVVESGHMYPPNARIIGGSPVNINRFPFAASLQDSGGHFCGGSLITKHVVLSAAHCQGGRYSVKLGATEWDKGGQEIDMQKEVPHPGYDSRTTDKDYMLVLLDKPATLNNDVKLVKLNSQNAKPAVNDKVTVLGWGVTSPSGGGGVSDKLMTVDVNAISNNDCNNHGSGQNSYKGQISDHMLCAKGMFDIILISSPPNNILTSKLFLLTQYPKVDKTVAKVIAEDHSLTTTEYKWGLFHGGLVARRRNTPVSMPASQKNMISLRRRRVNTTSSRLKKLASVALVVVVDPLLHLLLLHHPALHLQVLLHQYIMMMMTITIRGATLTTTG